MLITMARKPIDSTLTATALNWGCGGLGVDATRVGAETRYNAPAGNDGTSAASMAPVNVTGYVGAGCVGRFPANVILTASLDRATPSAFPEVKGQVGMVKTVGGHRFIEGDTTTTQQFAYGETDRGSAARFFKQIG